jgi:hypothetical protein
MHDHLRASFQNPVDLDTDAAKAALKTSLTAKAKLTAASVALAPSDCKAQAATEATCDVCEAQPALVLCADDRTADNDEYGLAS